MRFSTCIIAILTCVFAIMTKTRVDAVAGVCGLTLTCPRNTSTTLRLCLANETAEFNLLAQSLQTCEDVSYFFNNGQPWPIDEKTLYCRDSTPCGRLVPYITSSNISLDMCDKFGQYANVIDTFRDLCRGQPVQNIVGNNGLLAELKAGNGTRKTTPSPTRFVPSSESIDYPSTTQVTGSSDAASSIVQSVPMLLTLAVSVSMAAIDFA